MGTGIQVYRKQIQNIAITTLVLNLLAIDLYTGAQLGDLETLLKRSQHKSDEFKVLTMESDGYRIRLQDNSEQVIRPPLAKISKTARVIDQKSQWVGYKSAKMFSASRLDVKTQNNERLSFVIYANTAFGKGSWFLAGLEQNGKPLWRRDFKTICGNYVHMMRAFWWNNKLRILCHHAGYMRQVQLVTVGAQKGRIEMRQYF